MSRRERADQIMVVNENLASPGANCKLHPLIHTSMGFDQAEDLVDLLALLLGYHSLTGFVKMLNSSGSPSIIIVNYSLIYPEFRYRTVFIEVVLSLL